MEISDCHLAARQREGHFQLPPPLHLQFSSYENGMWKRIIWRAHQLEWSSQESRGCECKTGNDLLMPKARIHAAFSIHLTPTTLYINSCFVSKACELPTWTACCASKTHCLEIAFFKKMSPLKATRWICMKTYDFPKPESALWIAQWKK